jgi:hypothetical protein
MADINLKGNQVWTYIPYGEYDPAKHELPVAGAAIKAGQSVGVDSSDGGLVAFPTAATFHWRNVGLAEQDTAVGEPARIIAQQFGTALEDIPEGATGLVRVESGPMMLLVTGKDKS